MDIQDLFFETTVGMSKKAFLRKAGLMRNPEWFGQYQRCPICKKALRQNDQGDLFCTNYSIGYEKDGGCYWHRYADGLNYWSSPEEMFAVMAEKDPEFKKIYEDHKKRE